MADILINGKSKVKSFTIQEPYKTEYKKASNGKWEYEEYWTMSHLERRKANPQKQRRPFAIHAE